MTKDIIKQVAFATGRILHAGTGEPIVGSIRITAREGPVVVKLLEDGVFALSGDVERLFPDPTNPLHLDIRADSAQFRWGFVVHSVTVTIRRGSDFDPEPPPDPPPSPAPLFDMGTIELPADSSRYLDDIPVNIRGRVVRATDPDIAIANARVRIRRRGMANLATMTDAEGRYLFNNIVVLAPASIRCSRTNFIAQERPLVIDFGRLTHEEYFRLAPMPSP